MNMEQVLFLYALIFFSLLVPVVWLLMRRRAQKKLQQSNLAADSENAPARDVRSPVNWSALLALRPQAVLSGEQWLKTFIVGFVALCVCVIAVVFVFPLGALWAASAAFVAMVVIVAVLFMLID